MLLMPPNFFLSKYFLHIFGSFICLNKITRLIMSLLYSKIINSPIDYRIKDPSIPQSKPSIGNPDLYPSLILLSTETFFSQTDLLILL